ncbi:MAG: glycogen synthase GlgA [Thermoanaerobaculia bacterium]
MQILFASAEVTPFAKTGGLGDVCGSLPKFLPHFGHEVHVFCPFYREVRSWCERHGATLENRGRLDIGDRSGAGSFEILRTVLPGSSVPVWFVSNDHYFDRGGLYWGRDDGFDDNLERYAFFSRAIVASAEHLGLRFDIVHAHDWQAALLPIRLDAGLRHSSSFAGAASVYTIHNLNYQGRYGADRFAALELPTRYLGPHALEYYGDIVLMKGGIVFADRVTTVSPTYAREIQTPEFGAGFDGLLRESSHKLSGILNGIDPIEWDPSSDPLIAAPFSAGDPSGKGVCKKALRKEAGLEAVPRTPLLCAISRLVEQKGFDLFIPLIPKLVRAGWQIAVLGTGEYDLERELRAAAEANPGSVAAWTRFDTPLAHRIIAGSDATVMPSRYEPCGLNQMYALRYGTLPIVRSTGGLADTVDGWDGTNASSATGFSFTLPEPEALDQTLLVARMAFRDRPTWSGIQRRGMGLDFSWDASAAEYDRLYRSLRPAV